jgi:hypothetical protein
MTDKPAPAKARQAAFPGHRPEDFKPAIFEAARTAPAGSVLLEPESTATGRTRGPVFRNSQGWLCTKIGYLARQSEQNAAMLYYLTRRDMETNHGKRARPLEHHVLSSHHTEWNWRGTFCRL